MSWESSQPWRHQPSGLYLFSACELFERLAFGAMLPLFALYLHEHLGHSEAYAIALSSGFLAGSYLASVPGGIVADRFLGATGALLLGVLLSAIGFIGLATDRPEAFWPAIVALLLGQGLVKPNITTLIGRLYAGNDPRREGGFSLFYVSINIGALAGPLLAEWARVRWGWPSIFVCAAGALGPALLFLGRAVVSSGRDMVFAEVVNGAGAGRNHRDRARAILLLCGVSVVFWLAFQQTGTSLALFAERQTIPWFSLMRWRISLRPGHFAALHAGLVIGLTPLLLWAARYLYKHQATAVTPLKMAWGFLFTAAAFALAAGAGLHGGDTGRVSPLWLGGSYILLSLGELLLSPMGLSLMTRLAPSHLVGRYTGLWFAAVAVGHGLAAVLGVLWSTWPHSRYFACVAALALLGAAVLGLRLRALESLLMERRR